MIDGLVFETREDDFEVQPTNEFDHEQDVLVAEQSWNNPEEFGQMQSTFGAHVAQIERRSQELGIINEYSEEIIRAQADVDLLYDQMISYDDFYMLMCACPEDFGMSEGFVEQMFGGEHGPDDGHGHGDDEDEKKRLKKKKKTNWFSL